MDSFSANFESLTAVREMDDVYSYYKINRHLYNSALLCPTKVGME